MHALINKYVGWFVLLAYFAAGTWVARSARTTRAAIAALLVGAAVVTVLDLAPNFASGLGISVPRTWTEAELTGLMGNSNAFCFLLLVLAAALLPLQRERARWTGGLGGVLVLAALLLGVLYSGSRAGWLGIGGVIIAAVAVRQVAWSRLLAASIRDSLRRISVY